MRTFTILLLIASGLSWAEEPSAFGAGNLDSDTPYGLTKTEQHIFENRQTIQKTKEESFQLKTEIESLKQAFEGFRGVADGELSKLRKQMGENRETSRFVDDLNRSLAIQKQDQNASFVSLRDTIEQNSKIQNENIEKLQQAMEKIGKLVDTINEAYVSREEFNRFKQEVLGIIKRSAAGSDVEMSGEENALMFQKAHESFQDKRYADAKTRFETTLENHYKPANSSFHLGEIAYFEKRFEEAVYYFKQSASLYDKADYMPTLLLHSADSFVELNDKGNAKLFYQKLIEDYPDTKEASQATKALESIS